MNYIFILIGYIIIINIISFFTMFYDKRKAKYHDFRISENTLFMLSILLGGIGTYAGMYTFRHKTKHLKFTIGIPIVIILNIVSVYYILSYIITHKLI